MKLKACGNMKGRICTVGKWCAYIFVILVVIVGLIWAFNHFVMAQYDQKINALEERITALEDSCGNVCCPKEPTEACMEAKNLVTNFMLARLQRNAELAKEYLTEDAIEMYEQPGYSLIGASNPHYSNYKIMSSKEVNKQECRIVVRIYEESAEQSLVGYFNETLTVIKTKDCWKICKVVKGPYEKLRG